MNPAEMIPLCSGRPDFVALWTAGCLNMQSEQDSWVARLRSEGVKAAHPDDGWVNRTENYFQLCYPQFNDGAGVGDKVALGWAEKHRIVTVTRVEQSPYFSSLVRYFFTP